MPVILPSVKKRRGKVMVTGNLRCQHHYDVDNRDRGTCRKCGRTVDWRVQEDPVPAYYLNMYMSSTEPDYREPRRNTIEGHISLPEGQLLHGPGCRLEGVDYECFKNLVTYESGCPYSDDCRAPGKSMRMSSL